jgi:phosphate transport system substrate-binding protein
MARYTTFWLAIVLAVALLAGVFLMACSPAQPVAAPKATTAPAAPPAAAPTTAPAAPTVAAQPTINTAGVKLTGAGATFPYPLYTKWIDVYGKAFNVMIDYQSIGSGGGIKQITEKTVDFGGTDAFLTEAQQKAASGEIYHIPMALGAVVLTYNVPGIEKGLKLTPENVVAIYMGKLTKWNDPKLVADNPDLKLPASDILVVSRSDGSGTTNIFTDYLSNVSADWKSAVGVGTSVKFPVGVGAKGNEGVAGQVSQTPGCIGYVELAYAIQNKMGYATLKNKAGKWVEPNLDSTTAAAAGAAPTTPDDMRVSIVNPAGDASYPIAGYTWIMAYKEQSDAAKGKALVDFLWWAIHDGQSLSKDLLYAPLPKEVVAKAEARIKLITFQGKPIKP